MAHWIRVLLLLLLVLVLGWPAEAIRVRKKATRPRACLDLPEEILEQMFGRLSVGVMSAFHHALQLEPQDKLNLTCPTTSQTQTDSKTRLPVNLLSISPWAYRISYDPARYPRYIPEAYCLCKGCLIGPYGEESDQHRSTPVYAPSVILRRASSCIGVITKTVFVFHKEQRQTPLGEGHKYNINISLLKIVAWKVLHFQGLYRRRVSSKCIQIKLERRKNNRVHTFKILEALGGKMQTWYPCFI